MFRLLYFNYIKRIIEIFSDNTLSNQIFYNILNNFFECNIINKIINNNEDISQNIIYLKEIFKILFIFSIHYFYDILTWNFNFEKYTEIINNNLDIISIKKISK